MPKRYSSQRGFTLVELTIVIVILGILSVFAASRFQGASSFSPYAAQAQAISVIRQIQLARMQSNTADGEENPQYQLYVSDTCLGSPAACSGNESLSSKVQIDGQDLKFTITPESDPDGIQFDLLGRPLPLTSTGSSDTGTSYQITIKATGNDVESTTICINSEGYVSGGDCK
ncbi:prepilin-type N-terminal cleavage/methylation domain-containing protein [Vibrio sp. CK2-1]|uniref:prepilin-type N-terminal cleavage/methylation domain-containing protein n=1 Tax=Vibrio sp. CK2-1 TaxID=2912249 RepID=UPI001F1A7E89|nr:prepilin-type N-terminal cleavage/methylation domain-containing protein [Vibrio sp. CK2-1]MCF7353829.1 prepilin-type N-terminal cleavage/methylation domain-containing protein [Vibrio sp. CK2-1]